MTASGRRSEDRRTRRRRPARIGLVLLVCVAPLWVGGAPPSAIPVSLGLALATALALWLSKPQKRWRRPRGLWIAGAMILLSVVSLAPLPPKVTRALQPEVHTAMVEAGIDGWRPLSLAPGATSLELAELSLLAIVFVLGAQFSWRRVAGAVTTASVSVAVIGVVQEALGMGSVLGLYAPRLDRTGSMAMFTTFINPNHQASLFGLGAACAFALGRSLRRRASHSSDGVEAQRQADLGLACLAACGALLAASVFSISRGALLAQALATVLVVTLVIRARKRGGNDHGKTRIEVVHRIGRLLAAAAPVGLVIVVASLRGVWRDLGSLASDAGYDKPRAVLEGLEVYALSPWVGVGRGAFNDAFTLISERPLEPVFTHLESVPATMLVEWGPLGAVLAVALAGWWIAAFAQDDRTSIRIILLGLFAVGLQSLLDFGPDLLGVSVPMVGMAGAISPRASQDRAASFAPRTTQFGVVVMATVAAVAFIVGRNGTFVTRRQVDAEIAVAPPPSPETEHRLIRRRPLDAHLHLSLARAHGRAGEWEAAGRRAGAARRIDPRGVDPWVLEAEALRRLGEPGVARERLANGLVRLDTPPSAAFASHVADRFPEPMRLVEAIQDASPTMQGAGHLGRALIADHPEHADALAASLLDRDPLDPEHLELRARTRLAVNDPDLALHFARLFAQARPSNGHAHVLQAWAYARRRPADPDRRIAVLEAVVEAETLTERGAVEEELIRALRSRGTPADLERARALGLRLLRRPAKASVKQRRRELVHAVSR